MFRCTRPPGVEHAGGSHRSAWQSQPRIDTRVHARYGRTCVHVRPIVIRSCALPCCWLCVPPPSPCASVSCHVVWGGDTEHARRRCSNIFLCESLRHTAGTHTQSATRHTRGRTGHHTRASSNRDGSRVYHSRLSQGQHTTQRGHLAGRSTQTQTGRSGSRLGTP